MKQFTIFNQLTAMPKRLAMVLTVLFTLGVGSMWGAEEVYKETIFNSSNNSGKISSYSNSWSNTTNSFKVNITNANNNNNGWAYIRMGSSSSASTGTIITASSIDKKITKVSLNIGAITSSNVTSIKLYKSTNNSTWVEIGSFSISANWQNVVISDANQGTNLYYKIEAVCTKASKNGPLQINGLRFYIEDTPVQSYTVSWTINPAEGGRLSAETGNSITVTPNAAYTYGNPACTVSPAGKAKVFQSTNTFTATPTENCTIQINMVEKPKYTVTLDAGPGTCAASVTETSAGKGVTLPEPTLNCGEWGFAGWTTSSVANETSSKPATLLTGSYKPTSNITLYAVYQRTEETPGTPTVTTTTDKLTRATTGVTNGSTTYSSWNAKKVTSSAVYAGNSAGGNDAIQLRSEKSTAGIVTTASGGKAKKVTVVWQSSTADGRTLDIYGKKSAYSAATELYDNTKQGTKLGSIAKGSTTLTITGDYEYIGLRSNSGAMYLTSISIDWATTTGGGSSSTTYYHSTPVCADPCDALQAPNVTATATANSITLSWAAVPDATLYTIYNYTTEATDETTNLTYTFNGLNPNKEYEWEVEAVSATCNGKGTKGTTTTPNACEKLGNATDLNVETNYLHTDGKTYVKFSWTPADNTKEYATNQKICFGKVGEAGTCVDDLEKNLTWTGDLASKLSAGEYWWSIQALGDGTNYCDGDVVKGSNFTIYSITYNTNGGNIIPATSGTTLPAELPAPTKTGYTFAGWYTDSEFNTPATAGNAITQNTILHAKWTINQYTVTLNPNYPDGKTGTFKDKGGNTVSGNLVFTYDYNTASKTLADLYTSLTLDGYEFGGWYNAKGANPGEVSGSKCTETNTITGDKIYYAKWSKLYTITLSGNGTTTTPTTQTSTSYTLPTELSAGSCQDDTKELVGWSTVEIPNPGDKPTSNFYELGETVTLTADQTTFYAVFATVEGNGGGGEGWTAVTSTSDLEAGATYAISSAATEGTYLSTWDGGNNFDGSTSTICPLILGGSAGAWTFQISDGSTHNDKYLTATSAASNRLKAVNPVDNYSYFKISFDNNGNAVITCTGKNTNDILRYNANNGSPIFACYSSGQSPVYLQKYASAVSYSDYATTCVALPNPVISFVTTPADPIVFDPVNCGSTTSKAQAKTVQVSGENLRDVVNVSVTGPYKIARTSSTALNAYTTSLTLDKTAAGAIHSNYQTVYIISTPPAQSTEATTGTLTFTTTKGNTLNVNLSTPTVTCTQHTLTLVDRGVSTEQPTKYYAGETIDEAPADPEGVCTDPIHYVFDGWAEATVAAGATTYTKVTFPYTVTGNTKFYAVYRYLEGGGNGDYNLVTSALDDWSGDYLIAYSDQIFANGTIGGKEGIGAAGEKVDLSSYITNNTIPAAEGDKYKVSLEAINGGYLLKTQDGKYNYQSSNTNGLEATTNKNTATNYKLSVNFVSFEEINLCLSGGAEGAIFQYNTGQQGYFRFYKDGGQNPVYLYKKADGTTYYTTSPVCGPHLAITEGKDIYVTGGNAGGTRDLVIAQTKVSYKATRLEKDKSTGNLPSIKALPSNIVFDNTKTKAVAVTFDEDSVRTLQSDGTYTITGNITIAYQPAAANVTDDIQVTLNANYNPSADVSQASFTVHARSLPSGFVIVAKSGDKWYALNGDMNINAANPANEQVTLDNNANPTKATYAPCNAIYTFDGLPNTGDRTHVRFQGTEGAWLWASSGTNVGIQNNVLKTTPEGSNKAYNWKLYTEDNITYRFGNANSSRQLTLSGEKFGMYASGVQDIRILPYEAKCLYNYAPTNLKVSVLKGTYVTLTWDAVAGATKYQYSTDATNWTDCGTEPTATINGLTGATKYTYYIRAYHEDAGVSQECIDYAEITFTTANCDDVPTNITYTADLNSITVSWTAAAPTATIKLYLDENGEHAIFTQSGTTSPWKISTLSKNTTYYLQIFSNGTCASQIIPVKTEDVEVDIVEWYPQGIIVDINTDETVGVTLENEVSYGSGLGSLAEDLFFSKYFEGSGSLKMLAIYNGTGKDVNLSTYRIDKGSNGNATNISKTYDLSQLGTIKNGQEIIFYSWPLNTSSEESVYSCSQSFLNAKSKESGADANPRWILCDANPHNGVEFEAMDFSGDDPLLFYKDNTLIDVFGVSTAADRPSKKTQCSGRSEESWSADGVTNMDYNKTDADFEGGVIPEGVDLLNPTITAYTARVIMFRKNTVVSGKNAVTKDTTTFATFADEWEARQVCRSGDDGDLTCAAYQELGTFDYSKYYTKYESMGDEQIFDKNKRHEDGTVTVEIPNLDKQSCRNIRIKLTNSKDEVLTDLEYKVPIMITTSQGTDGQAFLNLQENLATVEVDGSGNPTGNKRNLTLDEVREICKTCDVVVRDNATLMKMADDAANDHPQVRNVYVYENSSLIVPNGTNYTINNLSLRRKGDEVSSLSAYPDALKLPESAAAPISLDFRLSAENWHWFTLPYNCNINEVTWADGTPAQYNTDWYLMTYDGEKRAETQAGGCWKAYTGTTINAGDGFIIAINGNINNPAHTYELHFPMSKEVLALEGTDKTVAVRAWGVETNIRPNHKGWNLVGNPYLAYYQRNNITNFEGLRLGQLTGPDLQTGYWEQTGDVPYIVVPVGAGWIAYEQVLASETDLLPFTAYFVQVGNDGKHDSSDELSISFDHTKLQLSATPMPASIVRRAPSEVNETEEPVIVGVALTNSLGESDKTSLVIADRFTNEYEMQADFFKWFGDYYNYYTKPVLYTIGADQGKRAFNALNEELAKQPIPMGMYAAQAGNYTFSLNQQFDLSRVEEVWLYDATQSTYTNLMQSDYTFSTSKVNGAGRFSLSVKLAPKVATSIDNVTADKVWATTHTKQVIVNGLENGMHLWLYDATGKLLYNEPTSNYQHTYAVPQTGTYFVSVMNGNQKQTIKVVVE